VVVSQEAKQMYREVYILRQLRGSPHIITLQDVIAPLEPGGRPFKDLCVFFSWTFKLLSLLSSWHNISRMLQNIKFYRFGSTPAFESALTCYFF
jgi:serine/threonine protein kinase